ncbi:MAG: Gfo/Idh/MocA family oxidoreductase [Chloroflexi bacterium]|nr:Gfo/Idh/MocA family oxidoreductase [Chloroflexota bacterium]
MAVESVFAGEKLKVGIIGCGALGIVHARRFGEMEGVTVTALSDPQPESMAKAAEALHAPPALQDTDYRALLGAGLDAVCIASPDGFHVAQVLDALAAGLHVLCEKPLTRDPAELQALLDARDAAGKHVAMTYPRHYDPGVRAMRREIQSGRWGAVKTVTVYNGEDWITPNVGTWRHDPALCPGGFFFDASGHQLGTLFWVTGLQGVTVRAEAENRGTAVPIVVWGAGRLTGHIPFSFAFVGDGHQWREQVNIHCEKTDFMLETGRSCWVQEGKVVPMAQDEPRESGDRAFVRLLRGEGPNWSPPDELWPLLHFTNAALRSAETGESSDVPAGPSQGELR